MKQTCIEIMNNLYNLFITTRLPKIIKFVTTSIVFIAIIIVFVATSKYIENKAYDGTAIEYECILLQRLFELNNYVTYFECQNFGLVTLNDKRVFTVADSVIALKIMSSKHDYKVIQAITTSPNKTLFTE